MHSRLPRGVNWGAGVSWRDPGTVSQEASSCGSGPGDLGQVPLWPWASVPLSVKWEEPAGSLSGGAQGDGRSERRPAGLARAPRPTSLSLALLSPVSRISFHTCNVGDLGSIPGLGRSPGEGKGYPLQYFGLENSMDCIVLGVAKSQTRPAPPQARQLR